MNITWRPLLAAALLSASALTSAETGLPSSSRDWWESGRDAVQQRLDQRFDTEPGAAKNVILVVGDGMSVTTVTAARILAGQKQGGNGEGHALSFEGFPATALAKTYNTDQQTPDSAGTMTAMVTGVKTRAGVLSLGPDVTRGRCEKVAENRLPTLLELAEQQGRSTGIVTTTRLTHATPAATYAKTPERDWEDDTRLPDAAANNGCVDIARQFVAFSAGDGIEVALGGGRRHFVAGVNGRRGDDRNLINAWRTRYPEGDFVSDRQQLLALKQPKRLFGLFSDSHMQFDAQRRGPSPSEPSLAEMAQRALDVLQDNTNGYFLMLEAGRIDHAHHAGIAYQALHDTLALSEAVAAVLERVDLEETLIVVTADHSHVFTMGGYPTRGNPILGYVVGNDEHGHPEKERVLAEDGRPYTTLGYHNGPGAGARTASKQSVPDPAAPDYRQQAVVPLRSETHGGEDVAVYATGPGSHLFRGVMEQHVIFHLIDRAAGLTPTRPDSGN